MQCVQHACISSTAIQYSPDNCMSSARGSSMLYTSMLKLGELHGMIATMSGRVICRGPTTTQKSGRQRHEELHGIEPARSVHWHRGGDRRRDCPGTHAPGIG